ncbi:MAG: lauroyl acyltransferase [Mariprofundus sp.]|nr:lauroyl acyltransferase [Mariprofundus sp.]
MMASFAVRLFFTILRLIPVRLLGAFGAGLGRAAYYLDVRHRGIAMRNLNRVYPGRPDAWKRQISRESFAELGRTCFELPHVYLRSKTFLLSRIEIENEQVLLQAESLGKGVILTACHHSNWELGALCMSMLGHHAEVVYRTVRQLALDHFVLQARSRFGATLRARDAGLRWMPRALKKNHCVAVMVDQHLSNGSPVPFLGYEGLTTTMPAIFTNKYHTPVVGVELHRIGKGFHFRLKFCSIPVDEQVTDDIETMRVICDSFAPMIHQRPELWLWIHRRWLYLDEKEQDEQGRDEQNRKNQEQV